MYFSFNSLLAQIKFIFTTMVKQKRKSAKAKGQLVLELLRGKLIQEVSRDNQVTITYLSVWRSTFLLAGENGFMNRILAFAGLSFSAYYREKPAAGKKFYTMQKATKHSLNIPFLQTLG